MGCLCALVVLAEAHAGAQQVPTTEADPDSLPPGTVVITKRDADWGIVAPLWIGYAGADHRGDFLSGRTIGGALGFHRNHLAIMGFIDNIFFVQGEDCGFGFCIQSGVQQWIGGLEVAFVTRNRSLFFLVGGQFGPGVITDDHVDSGGPSESTGAALLGVHSQLGYKNIIGGDARFYYGNLIGFSAGIYVRLDIVLCLLLQARDCRAE